MTTPVSLYGGAIRTVIPEGFKDVSLFRQVPDSQEVFVSDQEGIDDSIVFDIMERVDCSDEEAIAIHLEEIARLNTVQDYKSGLSTKFTMSKV